MPTNLKQYVLCGLFNTRHTPIRADRTEEQIIEDVKKHAEEFILICSYVYVIVAHNDKSNVFYMYLSISISFYKNLIAIFLNSIIIS